MLNSIRKVITSPWYTPPPTLTQTHSHHKYNQNLVQWLDYISTTQQISTKSKQKQHLAWITSMIKQDQKQNPPIITPVHTKISVWNLGCHLFSAQCTWLNWILVSPLCYSNTWIFWDSQEAASLLLQSWSLQIWTYMYINVTVVPIWYLSTPKGRGVTTKPKGFIVSCIVGVWTLYQSH